MPDKHCARCGETKDTSEFCKDARTISGLNCTCRTCRKEIHKTAYDARIKVGICNCGEDVLLGRTLCGPCLATQVTRMEGRKKARSQKLTKMGRCTHCGGPGRTRLYAAKPVATLIVPG